jgi:glutamine---fructose-6-phosphate transaminase (isomerizing)
MTNTRDPAHHPEPLSAQRLLDDTLGIPQTLHASFAALVDSVEHALAGANVVDVDAFVLAGSGDLYHSALATEVAFERLTGVSTRALTSMSLGLYHAIGLSSRTVVIQMSFSGKTARAVEAATLARASGARIWGLTGVQGSALAALSERCLIKPDTGRNEAAGYPVTMLLLYLVAIRVAEMRNRLDPDQASTLRKQLREAFADMQATLEQCMSPARELVARFIDTTHALFLSSGPTYGSAANNAARVLEAVGLNASAQDIEEWVHLNRWVEETRSPTFVIVPRGPSRDRAGEVVKAMTSLGKPNIAVVSHDDTSLGGAATAWLPVHCRLPEEFSPLVHHLPGELFAHLLGVARRSHPYRSDMDAYLQLGEIRWGGIVRTSMPTAALTLATSKAATRPEG